jgi:hypothetical protein
MKPEYVSSVKLGPLESIKLGYLVAQPRNPLAQYFDPFDRTSDGGFSSDIPLDYPKGTEKQPVVEENVDFYCTIHRLADGSVECHPLSTVPAGAIPHALKIKAQSKTTYTMDNPGGIWKRIEQAVHCQQVRPGEVSAQEWLRDRDRHVYLVTGLVTLKQAEIKDYHINLGKTSFHGTVSVPDLVALATGGDVAGSALSAIASALMPGGATAAADKEAVKHRLEHLSAVVKGKSLSCNEESIFLIKCQRVDLKQQPDWTNGRLESKVGTDSCSRKT